MTPSMDFLIGYHCAPVIRAIKVANLIAFPKTSLSQVCQQVKAYNHYFNKAGLHFYVLCSCPKQRLVLVYRKRELAALLGQASISSFLESYGYKAEGVDQALRQLRKRVTENQEFPHEIGIFLGYPLLDVQSFIRQKGKGSCLCGGWKAYTNQSLAAWKFYCYRICRQYCYRQLVAGKSLESLVIKAA